MSRYAPRSSVTRFDELELEAAAFAQATSAALKASAVDQPVFAVADAGGGPAAGFLEGSATGSPFLNFQPSLGLTQVMPLSGVFPSRDGPAGSSVGFLMGQVRTTAANFSFAEATASGQTLSIAQNTALFSILGTTYGGNGQTTFALPDLRSSVAVGTGQGPGLTEHVLGERFGSGYSSLTATQMPSAAGGGGQPFNNQQPSLGLSWIIAVDGSFPSTSGFNSADMMGTLSQWSGNFEPAGYMYADGRSLAISEWSTLFALIGTTYGGDGQTTFNIPDLRGRTAVGADANSPVGTVTGSETTNLTTANLPAGVGGQGTAVSNLQPTLAVTYLICTQGFFPSRDRGADGENIYIGEIIAFAGGFAPAGFMQASGQILSIAQNTALFSLLGTTYGGNGTSTFALPNLNDRAVIGTGQGPGLDNIQLGQQIGSTDITLLASNVLNAAPDILNLQATDTGTEQVYDRLDEAVDIRDFNLDARNGGNGDYAGASLALSRAGGANTQDAFRIDGSGAPFTVVGTDAGGELQSGGLTFATYAYANGVLTVEFTSSGATATSALVDAVASRIAYANQSDAPPASVSLSYTFRDGNGGSHGAAGQGAGGQGVHIGSSLVSLTGVDDLAAAQNDAVQGAETAVLNGNVFADNGSGADSDPDGSLTVIEVNGVAASVGNQITLASGALLTLNANGTFAYDPNGAFEFVPSAASGGSDTGTDSFTYTLAGGGTATVQVSVSGVDNDDIVRGKFGGGGDDTLFGGVGIDLVEGLEGNDTLSGGTGDDVLNGGIGGDILSGNAGTDALNGGDGSDTADYSTAGTGVEARLNRGSAAIDGDGGSDTFTGIENLTGSAFNDILVGDAGGNVLTGGTGFDQLIGLGGNDTLSGGAGVGNEVHGGLGDDTYVVTANDTVVELAGQGTDLVQTSNASHTLAANVENLTYTGAGAFTGRGNALANVLRGGAGNDILSGRGGNDTFHGEGGSDTVDYGLAAGGVTAFLPNGATDDGDGGADTFNGIENLRGSAFSDLLYGDTGANVLDGGTGDDILVGRAGNDTLRGGAGTDAGDYSDATSGIFARLSTGIVTDGEGGTDFVVSIENVNGGAFDDVIIGSNLDNSLAGGGGRDQLVGGGGNDTLRGGTGAANELIGGLGDDTYVLDANDTIEELTGQGTDTIETSRGFQGMAANVENLTYTGSGNFNGVGNGLANVISGGAGLDTLEGGGGNDTLNGGGGNDLAQMSGLFADYVITDMGGGSFTIADSVGARDGTDTLNGVERVRFSSGQIITLGGAPAPVLSDKDADGPQVLPAVADDDFLVAKNGDQPEVLPGADEVEGLTTDRTSLLPERPGHMLILDESGGPVTGADTGRLHDHDGWIF